jgi:hypothetical protein
MSSEKFCGRDGISIMLVTKYDTRTEQRFLIVLQLQHYAVQKSSFLKWSSDVSVTQWNILLLLGWMFEFLVAGLVILVI